MKLYKLENTGWDMCDFCGRVKECDDAPYIKVEGEDGGTGCITVCRGCLRELVRKGSKEVYGD